MLKKHIVEQKGHLKIKKLVEGELSEESVVGLKIYAERALASWKTAAGALEDLRYAISHYVGDKDIEAAVKVAAEIFAKSLSGDRGERALEDVVKVMTRKAREALGKYPDTAP